MGHIAHQKNQFKSRGTFDYIIKFIRGKTCIISFLKVDWSLCVNFESTLPKDALCQVWLKLAQWYWRRRFLNFINIFSLFCNYLPFEKNIALHWTNLNALYPYWPSVLVKIFKRLQFIFFILLLCFLGKGHDNAFF